MIEVFISSLSITAEDEWLRYWTKIWGDRVEKSPQYLYLIGNYEPIEAWMKFRGLSPEHLTRPLMKTLQSLMQEDQKEPIKVYKDLRINTGHKRAAGLLFMGRKTIKVEKVSDDYKL